METPQSFALLIPAYNPTNGWETIFYKRYVEFCDAIQQKIPVVLINDGSTQNLSEGVSYLQHRIGSEFIYHTYNPNKGKGGALKFGADHVKSDFYMFTDIDFPYSTKSMKAVWQTMMSNKGIVIGYRENAYYQDVSKFRTYISKGLRWLNALILNLPVNDTQCGLKAFDQNVKHILLACQTDRFLIDLELLLAVNKAKLPIQAVSVTLRDDIDFTKFNATILIKELKNFVQLIWRYRILK
ncbi:MAG: glycosyltransferase [Saprospiraceae bacterium]